MPKFSQQEKDRIKKCLFDNGSKLFLSQGLKKVSIDDLARSATIAKATFYSFYESKEYLYMDIIQSTQKTIFDEMEIVLSNNQKKSAKNRVKEVFTQMQLALSKFPILAQIDSSTIELLSRKISQDRMLEFTQSNYDAAKAMSQHGITFSCDIEVASEVFQAIYHAWLYLHSKGPAIQKMVTNILLEGALDKILVSQ